MQPLQHAIPGYPAYGPPQQPPQPAFQSNVAPYGYQPHTTPAHAAPAYAQPLAVS